MQCENAKNPKHSINRIVTNVSQMTLPTGLLFNTNTITGNILVVGILNL